MGSLDAFFYPESVAVFGSFKRVEVAGEMLKILKKLDEPVGYSDNRGSS